MTKCVVHKETRQVVGVPMDPELCALPEGCVLIDLDLTKADIASDIEAALSPKQKKSETDSAPDSGKSDSEDSAEKVEYKTKVTTPKRKVATAKKKAAK